MNKRDAFAAVIAIVFLLLFCTVMFRITGSPPSSLPAMATAGSVLWKDRTLEVVLQGFIIIAGVVSILLLLVIRNRKVESG